MPLYRLRQSGESTTLLPSATHIDIASAMALWILGIGTSCGVCHPSMTTKVMALWTIMQHLPLTFFTPPLSTSFFSASCRFIGWGRLENPRPCCPWQRTLTLLPQWRYGYSGFAHPVGCATQVWRWTFLSRGHQNNKKLTMRWAFLLLVVPTRFELVF